MQACTRALRRSLAAKIALSALIAAGGSVMLRVFLVLFATVQPAPVWATEVAQRVVDLSIRDFWLACATGSAGGAVSLFRELRDDWSKFRVLWALGHMVTAQFAALMTYLLAVTWELPETLALVASGLFGWLGNAGLEKLSGIATRALGIGDPPRP
jgi:hypothetical protein